MSTNSLTLYLRTFLFSIPTLLVCFGACIVIIIGWKRGGAWQVWALLGFGLGLFSSIAMPIAQTAAQSWVMTGGDMAARAWVFTALGILWSLLHACVYILIFVAVVEGRKANN